MSRYQEAIADLREILAAQKPEPYTGRPRRPNNYRNSPEYQAWSAHRKKWAKQLCRWEKDGLELAESENRIELTLYGRTVPHTAYVKTPEGCVKYVTPQPYRSSEPFSQWAPPLPTPKPKENITKFLERVGQNSTTAYLKSNLEGMLSQEGIDIYQEFQQNNRNDLHYSDYDRRRLQHCIDFMHLLLEALRRLMDPKALARLTRLTGYQAEVNLRNHNLAVTSGEAVKAVAAANPGAAAWWVRLADDPANAAGFSYREAEPPEYLRPFLLNEPEEWRRRLDRRPLTPVFPQHPGEIIACARQDYAAAGGIRWKSLASQLAQHVAEQLERYGPWLTAWFSEVISAAALPKPEPPPASAPEPPARPNPQEPLMQPLFGARPSSTPAPARKPPPPPAPLQPPLEIKLMLLELHRVSRGLERKNNRQKAPLNIGSRRRMNVNQDAVRDAAIRQSAILACRRYAGVPPAESNSMTRRQLAAEFEDLADYLFAEPAAAARARTWKGLQKASARWHHANNLRAMRADLLEEARMNVQSLSGWETPFIEAAPAPGIRARVLTSAEALVQESLNLEHCVGGARYAEHCADGHTRIIHLHPEPGHEDPESPDRRGTTLEIYRDGPGWRQGQHRGLRNRLPTDREEQWARQFLAVWQEAMTQRTARRIKELESYDDADEPDEYDEERI